MDFKPAGKELERANRCFNRMKEAQDYDECADAWGHFLSHIENVFERIKRAAGMHSSYPSFTSKVNHQRATDELLIYLKQARNTVHHGMVDTSKFVPGGIGINPPIAGGTISNLHIVTDGFGNIHISSGSPIKVEAIPHSIELISCTNRGVTYPPPSSHLGQPLANKSPVHIAELGFKFYQEYLLSAERTFITN